MGITPDLIAAAEEYLASRRESYVYLLLDQAGLSELPSIQSMGAAEWRNLFDETGVRVPISVAPALISIGNAFALRSHTSLLKQIAKRGAFSSAVVMFASPESLDVVLKRLVVRLDVVLSDNMNALLRFYDPRILETLVETLSSEQAENFFGLASRWWYIDRTGKLLQIDSVFQTRKEKEMPLRLSATQEFSLIDATEPDRVLSILRQNVPRLTANIPLAEQYGFAKKGIDSAVKCGLRSTPDYVLYCALILAHGVDFSNKPDWQAVFADVRSGQGTFAELAVNNDDVVLWDMQ